MWHKKRNRTIVTLAMLTVLSGCAGNPAEFSATPPLPDHIYQQPIRNYYTQAEMGVFVFGSPLYAPGVGDTAAETISQQLLQQKVFRRITPLYQYGIIPLERQLAIARDRGMDLILIGNVLYFMEGSLSRTARADIEVQVLNVATGAPVWKAVAGEAGSPTAGIDYFILQTSGRPAPAATALMMKNTEKIVHLFQSESPAYQELSEDMKVVDKGYQYLAKGDYEKARPCFETAIGMAPENAHALYNLAMVHEMTGNSSAAVELYQKVVMLNPETTLPELIYNGTLGLSLTSLAQNRLEALK